MITVWPPQNPIDLLCKLWYVYHIALNSEFHSVSSLRVWDQGL